MVINGGKDELGNGYEHRLKTQNGKKAQGGSQTNGRAVERQKNACGFRGDRHSWSRFQPVFRRSLRDS